MEKSGGLSNIWLMIAFHYYSNFNGGGHFGLTEAGNATASVQRSRLIRTYLGCFAHLR